MAALMTHLGHGDMARLVREALRGQGCMAP